MSAIDEVTVVSSFNGAINAEDLDRLGELMTEAHRFVDSAGAMIDGRVACVDAWRGFFAAFPDYRNVFDECRCSGDGLVFVRERSVCSVAELDGPAEWRVVVREGLVDSGKSVNRLSDCLRPRLTSVEQFVSRR
jgi:ketosteroid isomerase-like protein